MYLIPRSLFIHISFYVAQLIVAAMLPHCTSTYADTQPECHPSSAALRELMILVGLVGMYFIVLIKAVVSIWLTDICM